MTQGVVSGHQESTFNRTIGLMAFGLACWLTYETWLAPSPASSVAQASPSQLQVQPPSASSQRLFSQSATSGHNSFNSSFENDSSDILERLDLWQYHQADTFSALDINQLSLELTRLARLGIRAIPAISQYLDSGRDVDFRLLANNLHSQQPTLRLALFEVLQQIGGDEAETIWAEELNRTTSPREIAALSHYLDIHAPGAYRESVIAAARHALSLATEDGINGETAGPLFLVFQQYGSAELVDELASVSLLRWGQYATVALAGLPDGKGISNLVQQVQEASPANLNARFTLQMLAQQADHHEAQMALFAGIQQGLIPDYLWPDIAAQLSGTYQIQIARPSPALLRERIRTTTTMTSLTSGGGQVLYGVHFFDTTLNEEQRFERLRLIENIYEQVTAPAAKRALEQAYNTLSRSLEPEGSF